jgi:hypothetical protein
MKNKKTVILILAIFLFGFGTANAAIDNPQIFVPVEAEVVEPSVTVTLNANGLNFGQILPDIAAARFAEIDVSGVGTTANPAGAQTAADGATVDDTDDTMASLIADPSVVLLSGTTRTAGGFTMVSDIAASVTVVFADTLTLTSDVVPAFGSPETMDVTEIQASSNVTGLIGTPIALVGGAPQYVHIGGVLNIGAGQGGGTYTNASGGLQVDIAFE